MLRLALRSSLTFLFVLAQSAPGCQGTIADGTSADADRDGWSEPDDCDDFDTSVHPGAPESCDGVDDDCDGKVDDEAEDADTLHDDADLDGFGDPGTAHSSCLAAGAPAAAGQVHDATDCDDRDPLSSPDAEESCNGRDDDCDGAIDEDLPTDGMGCGDPGPPGLPDSIRSIVLTVRTALGPEDPEDSRQVSVCLSADHCYRLDQPGVDDLRTDQVDTYSFDNVWLGRDAADRVVIRAQGGPDHWIPACIEVLVDGRQVHCDDSIGRAFGDPSGTLETWEDPEGLHFEPTCTTCSRHLLTHGPMVGAVGPDRARLWLRSSGTRRVAVRVAETSDVSEQPPVAWAYPLAQNDFTAVIDVLGLRPRHTYFYEVEVDGERSETRWLRTAPPAMEPSRFRFAFGSCTEAIDQPIFAQVHSLAPDLFLMIGDNHYANTTDLGSLRWFYRTQLEVPQRRSLLASTPTLAVWDDHDFAGNNTDGTAPGKDTSLRAFQEYWANPGYGTETVPGIFSRYGYGDVDFFLLDDRYYREVGRSLLGAEQTAWLIDELRASRATFKFLVCGSQWTAAGSTDSWAAFPLAREILFELLANEGVQGVVLLSGDVHRSELRLIDRTAAGGYDLPELTSSPMAQDVASCPAIDDPLAGEVIGCYDEGRSFVIVDVDTTAADPRLEARILDAAGRTRVSWEILASQLAIE